MQQEKEKALEAIRNLIAYYTSDFHAGCGYTGKQQLIYLTKPQSEVALRYGIPIGVRIAIGSPPLLLSSWEDSSQSGFSPASHRACDFHRTRRSINADYLLRVCEGTSFSL